MLCRGPWGGTVMDKGGIHPERQQLNTFTRSLPRQFNPVSHPKPRWASCDGRPGQHLLSRSGNPLTRKWVLPIFITVRETRQKSGRSKNLDSRQTVWGSGLTLACSHLDPAINQFNCVTLLMQEEGKRELGRSHSSIGMTCRMHKERLQPRNIGFLTFWWQHNYFAIVLPRQVEWVFSTGWTWNWRRATCSENREKPLLTGNAGWWNIQRSS